MPHNTQKCVRWTNFGQRSNEYSTKQQQQQNTKNVDNALSVPVAIIEKMKWQNVCGVCLGGKHIWSKRTK